MFGGMRGLIDPDTPKDVYERTSVDGKTKMKLVFSDEFETPGRSFVSTSFDGEGNGEHSVFKNRKKRRWRGEELAADTSFFSIPARTPSGR